MARKSTQTQQSNVEPQGVTPPHSIEAEQSVLGSILIHPAHWDTVSDLLIADDFYLAVHRVIFQEMENLVRQGKPIDLVNIHEHLKEKNLSESVGGLAYLAELSKNTPSISNVASYAHIVRDKAVLRDLIGASNDIAQSCFQTKGVEVKDILDEAERKVFAISEKRTTANEGPQNVCSILEKTIDRIELLSQMDGHNGITGVSTGFDALDRKTSGLQPSDLIIVAARPSMGKTTFAMNLCENAALKNDKPVLVFSLEMPAESIMMRTLASLSRVEQTKIRSGQGLENSDWAKISSTMSMFVNKPNLYIDDSSGLTPTELRSRARRVYRDNQGLSLIMVDYLQLMRAPGFGDNRTLEIAEISRSLKALAKELNVPVIALSQLNRSLENRADKRPVNSDLRESGSIEQDADLIMFIYRDEVYNKDSEQKGIAEIIIGKQRNGPIGRINLAFRGEFSRFDNLAEQYTRDDY